MGKAAMSDVHDHLLDYQRGRKDGYLEGHEAALDKFKDQLTLMQAGRPVVIDLGPIAAWREGYKEGLEAAAKKTEEIHSSHHDARINPKTIRSLPVPDGPQKKEELAVEKEPLLRTTVAAMDTVCGECGEPIKALEPVVVERWRRKWIGGAISYHPQCKEGGSKHEEARGDA